MATINEEAMAYEPPQTKNIADLKSVSTDLEIHQKEYTNKDGEAFTVKVITIGDDDYRVPTSVLKSLKAILEEKPSVKDFKVVKTGEGLKTEYTVVPL